MIGKKVFILLAIIELASAGYLGGGGGVAVGPALGYVGGDGQVLAAGNGVGPVDDVPPPKSVTYNVPAVSKVSYPGQALTRSVETYSAPSIEKTTTITRTITAPLNAPAERQVSYSAPSAPIVSPAGPVTYSSGGFGYFGAGGLGLGSYHGVGGLGLATTYNAPALGYSLGGPSFGYAAAPVAYAVNAPVGLSAPAAAPAVPAAIYEAPTVSAAIPSGDYGAPVVPSGDYGAPAANLKSGY